MTWKDFQIEKECYKEAWEKMKAFYTGDIRHFLDQSRIIVSAGRELEIDADIVSAFATCPAFFIDAPETIAEASDSSTIKIVDNWRIEVKFPYVDIDFIQELKLSPYCDKDKTFTRPSSADVVILKSPARGKVFNSVQ